MLKPALGIKMKLRLCIFGIQTRKSSSTNEGARILRTSVNALLVISKMAASIEKSIILFVITTFSDHGFGKFFQQYDRIIAVFQKKYTGEFANDIKRCK